MRRKHVLSLLMLSMGVALLVTATSNATPKLNMSREITCILRI